MSVSFAREKRDSQCLLPIASRIVWRKFADGETLVPTEPVEREAIVNNIGTNNHR
jgi:hypothetical protein